MNSTASYRACASIAGNVRRFYNLALTKFLFGAQKVKSADATEAEILGAQESVHAALEELESPLPGEVVHESHDLAQGKLFFTNYRIVILSPENWAPVVIPNLAIESVILARDNRNITITCRNGRSIRFQLKSVYTAWALCGRISVIAANPPKPTEIFAFQAPCGDLTLLWLLNLPHEIGLTPEMLKREFDRLGFSDHWKISSANLGFRISETYPEFLILPKEATETMLSEAAAGRFRGRIPTAVWREADSGAVLLRSSQPVISLIGNSYADDVNLVEMCRATADRNADATLVIRDCRSYTSAFANRAKGGGYENSDVYQNCQVKFMDLPNIHNVRNSFIEYRTELNNNILYQPDPKFCTWMTNVFNTIQSAENSLDDLRNGNNVLVHCSDGWDRTTQIVSLAKLLGDGYYRTIEGFEVLVRSEWIGFGHKFNDRNCVFSRCSDQERSPIFLQWLDCVYQLCMSNPTAFEFNQNYLVKVAQHSYSGLFGTFLFNSIKEYKDCLQEAGRDSLPSLWAFLRQHRVRFENHSYNSKSSHLTIPSKKEMAVWNAVYRPENFFSDNAHGSYLRSVDEDGIVDVLNIGEENEKRRRIDSAVEAEFEMIR